MSLFGLTITEEMKIELKHKPLSTNLPRIIKLNNWGASMAPYELTNAGGSIEHWNKEAGELWLKKIKSNFYKTVWLNPVHEDHWDYTSTISMISGLMEQKMYPLTISGISDAVAHLSRRH